MRYITLYCLILDYISCLHIYWKFIQQHVMTCIYIYIYVYTYMVIRRIYIYICNLPSYLFVHLSIFIDVYIARDIQRWPHILIKFWAYFTLLSVSHVGQFSPEKHYALPAGLHPFTCSM